MNQGDADMIGVVIPTCGIREYLWETLESVDKARAKCAPGEVIVCVNAGPKSAMIADLIQKRVGDWVRVEISNAERQLPLYSNWNICVSKVSKPYVHLLHDDDRVSPYFYDAIADLIRKNPNGAMYSSGALIEGEFLQFSQGAAEGLFEGAAVKLEKSNCFVNPAVVFNREIFPGFDDKWRFVADWNAWHELALRGEVYCTKMPLVFYRTHEGAATSQFERSGQNVLECRKLLETLQGSKKSVDYSHAAVIGYTAAMKAARLGKIREALKQVQLAASCRVMFKPILKITYAIFKAYLQPAVSN